MLEMVFTRVLAVVAFLAVAISAAPIEEVKAAEIDYVAGIVLYRMKEGSPEYVLLEKKSEPGDWSVPKGNMDTGEDELEAAIRETFEETSYLQSDYDRFLVEKLYFEYTTNANIEKKVTLFTGKLKVDKEVVIDPNEHSAFVWLNYEDAQKTIKRQYRDAFVAANFMIYNREGLNL